MTIGALLVLETKTVSGVQPGAVAEVVEPSTSEHYEQFSNWLKTHQEAAGEFVCVRFLNHDGADGFYLKKRFRFLDIKHNSKTAN